jgi:hypothetical protein
MTARNYDVILTVSNAASFVTSNFIVGNTTATVAVIANVNTTANTLKVKLSNILQQFSSSEVIHSNYIVISGTSLGMLTQANTFVSNVMSGNVTTAIATIVSTAPSNFIAEKNAFTQNPIVRLYSIYYPGEWYPPNENGNPTGQGEGRAWPVDFPVRFAEVVSDYVSDLSYNVIYDNVSYIPFPVNLSGFDINSDGKINELSLTVFNVDNLISALVEDPFLVGNNTSNSVIAIVNNEQVHGIDPRTVNANPADVGVPSSEAYKSLTRARANGLAYSGDVVGIYGTANASFTKTQTAVVNGTWQAQKQDTRDLLGAVVEIKTTFANFLDYWPEYSTARFITSNVIEVYNAVPYRVGDNVITSGNLVLTTPNATSLRTSLNLGNVANVNLNGNSSTVLSGNGAWIGTVPNAIIATTALNVMATGVVGAVANAEYSVLAETANSVALANVVGIGNIANINLNGNVLTVLAGNGQWVPQANSNGVAGVSQIVAGNGIVLSPSNGIGIVTVSANLSNLTVANANVANTANGLQAPIANTIITGGTSGQMIITNGSGNLSFATPNVGTVTRVRGNGSGLGFSLSGDVTSSGNLTLVVPNSASLTSSMGLGNVSSLNFNGNGSTVLAGNGAWVTQSGSTLFNYATEVVTLVTHTTGTYTHDLLTSSIVYSTAVATGSVVVAYRGNVSTTVNTLLSVGTSITATYVMTTGSTGYAVTGITVDGTSQTVNWAGGTTPSVVANTKMSYTFTIVKTFANTYTVLGTATRFGE